MYSCLPGNAFVLIHTAKDSDSHNEVETYRGFIHRSTSKMNDLHAADLEEQTCPNEV